jgi:hypothetical protein
MRMSVHQNWGVNPHFSWFKTKPNSVCAQLGDLILLFNATPNSGVARGRRLGAVTRTTPQLAETLHPLENWLPG